ncbi:hypothetical protein DH2020_046440 [Rehmannia glutinosa]|uniref:F-box domain-containing protein n=1 Tax=Rehmannia glutinosa TaxID=99300 RepID=A0ABR0UCC1_REHGL
MGSFENLNVDAISNLPADVINNILARLSLRDAVRTSVLSREWRYKWTFIPEIVFGYEFGRAFLRKHIERIIDQVLSRHQIASSILLFCLSWRNCICTKFMGTGGVPNRFPDSFSSLIVVDLSMYLDSIVEVASFLCLIRSSPKLQMLRVTLCVYRIDGAVTELLRAQETPDRYLNQLRRVEIEVYTYADPLKEFARYVLACAARLEEMVIYDPKPRFSRGSLLNLTNELNRLPRASPSADLLVIKQDELTQQC